MDVAEFMDIAKAVNADAVESTKMAPRIGHVDLPLNVAEGCSLPNRHERRHRIGVSEVTECA